MNENRWLHNFVNRLSFDARLMVLNSSLFVFRGFTRNPMSVYRNSVKIKIKK